MLHTEEQLTEYAELKDHIREIRERGDLGGDVEAVFAADEADRIVTIKHLTAVFDNLTEELVGTLLKLDSWYRTRGQFSVAEALSTVAAEISGED